MLKCYNKGCKTGEFCKENNTANSCQFHSGVPIFHEGLKGWSCCKKRTCDFTDFLNIPGCTFGFHNNNKPELPPAPLSSQLPKLQQNSLKKFSPSKNEIYTVPLIQTESAKIQWDHFVKIYEAEEIKKLEEQSLSKILRGTNCFNKGCSYQYEDEHSLSSTCEFHPGQPKFHEGLKFWTCCEKKTTDFHSFLNQSGCTKGLHNFVKKENDKKEIGCRWDFFQTEDHVTLSFFAKNIDLQQTLVQVHENLVDLRLVFEVDTVFIKIFTLYDIVFPKETKGIVYPSKLELKLKKARNVDWPQLEFENS